MPPTLHVNLTLIQSFLWLQTATFEWLRICSVIGLVGSQVSELSSVFCCRAEAEEQPHLNNNRKRASFINGASACDLRSNHRKTHILGLSLRPLCFSYSVKHFLHCWRNTSYKLNNGCKPDRQPLTKKTYKRCLVVVEVLILKRPLKGSACRMQWHLVVILEIAIPHLLYLSYNSPNLGSQT